MFGCSMMETEKKRWVTRADLWMISGILVLALVLLLFFHRNRMPGEYARISYDGDIILQIPLAQSGEHYYLLTEEAAYANKKGTDGSAAWADEKEFQTVIREISKEELQPAAFLEITDKAAHYNVILCQNGEIAMLQSSCPDQICVRHRVISAAGENIICLPHKIVVDIFGEKEGTLDATAY
ncbi:MAG: NusG domain II-containing protein [Muribaculaceae bacterium]|nr:NusG domain II-containing protein [Muribaculaceae bacterium]